MPELPEVETVRRSLTEFVRGRTVTEVSVRDATVLRGQKIDDFREALLGQTLPEPRRHGKLMYFPFKDRSLIVHLGMTGQLTVRLTDRADTEFTRHQKTGLQRTLQHPPDKHTHISIGLDDGSVLHYRDIRKFGRVYSVPESQRDDIISRFKLGADPLESLFDIQYLWSGINKRRAPIKAVLLDQKFIAGLGNIYVDEALYKAGIRPGRGAYRVKKRESSALHVCIKQVLIKGIEAGGTTLRDFVSGVGESGYNQEGLQIYGRYGQECLGCGHQVQRSTYAGRTSSWCRVCQR